MLSARKRNLDFYLLNLKKFLIYDIIIKKDFFSRAAAEFETPAELT